MDSPPLTTWVFRLVVVVGLVGGQMGGVVGGVKAPKGCGFQAIYNFGDSNSDTGGRSAAGAEFPPPNGQTFFGKPSGRVCDGRLIIDFIAENLGLPYLSPYLDSIGANFRHGANFATAGSSVGKDGYSPFHLDIQISQFIQFKSRTTALYNQLTSNGRKKIATCQNTLPMPDSFSKALYTFDIGQNDLSVGFRTSIEKTQASIPDILNTFSQAVQQLYKEGARVFWVHNTGPIGCLPVSISFNSFGTLDQNGCVKVHNEVAQEYNKQLKDRVSQLRANLTNSKFTYVDVYSAKYSLISNAKNLGFEDPFKFCCGSHSGGYVECGQTTIVNGTAYRRPSCDDPSKYINWDGIHYSEAANLLISKLIVNGSLSDPPTPIKNACNILP